MAQCSPAYSYSKVAFVLEGAQRQPFHLPHQCVESGVRWGWGQQQHSSFTRGGLAHHWLAPLCAEGEGQGCGFKGDTALNCSAPGGEQRVPGLLVQAFSLTACTRA